MRRNVFQLCLLILLFVSTGAYLAGAASPLFPWALWVPVFAGLNLWAWRGLMRPAVFALFCIWFYAWLGNLIPQSGRGAPVAPGRVERTEEAFVAAGEALFGGKGKCALCHLQEKGAAQPRCPDLAGIGSRAGGRREGMGPREYLVESMYLPAAYLVEGYAPIMPEVWKPPIGLTPLEIEMVVAYLQSLGGEVDISPIKPPVALAAPGAGPPRTATGDPLSGKQLFEETFECIKCHRVAGRGGEGGPVLGPDLTEIGAFNSIEYLEESILDPNAKIVAGFASTSITLGTGERLSGTVLKQDKDSLFLKMEQAVVAGDGPDREGVAAGAWVKTGGEQGDPSMTAGGKKVDAAGSAENESEIRAIAKTDIAVEPIADVESLADRGIFWIQGVFKDSARFGGEVVRENPSSLTIRDMAGEVTVDKARIGALRGRQMRLSSKMPQFDDVITIKQFNDLVAYLAGLDGRQAIP